MKKNLAVFCIASAVMLALLFGLSAVTENYNSQSKNSLLTFQRIVRSGQETQPEENFNGSDRLQNKGDVIYNNNGDEVEKYQAIKSVLTEVTFADYEDYLEMYEDMNQTAVYAMLDETEVKDAKVTPVLVNENYFEFNGISVQGEGITQKMINKKLRKAVISRSFAEEHFYGQSYIGKTFKLDGTRYQVSGVFEDKTDSFNAFCDDGREEVYLCYSGYEGYSEITLDYISAVCGTKGERWLKKADFVNLERIDFNEKNPCVNSFGSLVLTLLAVIMAVYILKVWFYSMGSLGRFTKEKLQKNYFLGFIRQNPVKILLRVLIIVGLPALLAASLYLAIYDFRIVTYYIDAENLFGISAMLDNLSAVLGRESTFAYGGDTYKINLYNFTLTVQLLLVVAIFAVVGFWFNSFASFNKESKTASVAVISALFIVSAAAIIVYLVTGGSYIFAVGTAYMAIIILFKHIRDNLKGYCS